MRRFHLLDPLRGLAALSVTLFHCVNSHPDVLRSPLGRLLMYGWAGVFIFFPISGYCIAAATQRYGRGGLRTFVGKRWRRIYPPYLASIVLAVGIGLAALPFNHGSIAALQLPVPAWASVLTLTQVFTPFAGRINPVYWSLCYEEQFYVVMALSLLIANQYGRALYLTIVTAAALVLNITGMAPQGLFTIYWVPFATGVGVYYVLSGRATRLFGVFLLALCVVSAWMHPEIGVFISLAGASAMLALAPFDAWFSRHASHGWLRPVVLLGSISYSLYLIHVPIGGRIVNTLVRVDAPVWLGALAGSAVSIAFAYVFFKAVEERFLSTPQRSERDRVAERQHSGNAVLEVTPRFS